MAKNKNDETDIESQLLLRELEDEHRRAQMAKLWSAYGTYALVAAALIVVGVGGFKWYEWDSAVRRAEAGARYEQALQDAAAGAAEATRSAFAEIAQSGSGGYATLAQLQVAAAELKAGRRAEAVAAYEAVAADRSADELFRDFASLQAAIVRSGTADWTEMQNRLNDLVADTNPWRFSARELWGVAALKAGKLDEARRSFEQLLSDQNTPPSIGQRAQIMMGQIVAAELAQGTPPATKKE